MDDINKRVYMWLKLKKGEGVYFQIRKWCKMSET